MYRTPKKPAESRATLADKICRKAHEMEWTPFELANYLMTFFTNVDLKLILDDMNDVPARRKDT
jgi:hypothetical protein